jgi:hypothetical protein
MAHVGLGDELAVEVPQHGLEQHLDGKRQAPEGRRQTTLFEGIQTIEDGGAAAGLEAGTRAEGIGFHGSSTSWNEDSA